MKALKILVAASVTLASVTAFAASGSVSVDSGSVTAGSVTATSTAASTGSGTSASLNVDGAPTLVSATPTSVTLQWNKVAAAVSYVVKYSKTSVATSSDPNAVYDNETAPVTDTGTTIDKLTANTTYYFAVVALDKDGNESDTLSEELVVDLSKAAATASGSTASGATSGLALVSVTAKDTRTLTVEFSAALGTDPVTVKLQKTANSASIPVASVTVDSANPTTATVTTDADLEGDSTYSLTVISAKDAAGNNIPEGINAIKEFTTVASLAPAVPLNAAAESGATASGATAAPAATALPTTGTRENLILILALLSGLGIVFAFRKKAA